MSGQSILATKKNKIRRIDGLVDMTVADTQSPVQYQCSGSDPQCQFELLNDLKPGWYTITYEMNVKGGKVINPKFYLDTGRGYNEEEIISLPGYGTHQVSETIYLPKKVFRLRFDPTENKMLSFSLGNLALKRVSPYELFKKIYRKAVDSDPNGNTFRKYLRSVYLILTNRVKKIEELIQGPDHKDDIFRYQEWINLFDSYNAREFSDFKQNQLGLSYRPKISVLLPVYNTPLNWLRECIQSVIDQVYDNWELCIVDDHSPNEEVRDVIKEFAARDNRIRYLFRSENGHIAIASNTALSLATGEFVALLDHDDKLAPLALYRMVEAMNLDPTVDFLYSDEDKIDNKGERSLPFFKPDWSPALFYTQNYITHLACIRRKTLLQANGFTEGSEGSQDYDLFLKVIATGAKIQHLSYVLYHWRLHDTSTSMVSESKPYAHVTGKKALEKFLSKKYPFHFSRVEDGAHTFTYLPRFNFSRKNKVSIIIPTKDKIEYLEPCIESIIAISTWSNYEILILNNNSTEESSFNYFRKLHEEYDHVRVVDALFEFNWSKLNNFGSEQATGNFLIFLNNDVSVITPDWMERLCEYAGLPDTAAVGPSLLYEDDTIQHAGVVVGMNGWADHVFKGMPRSHYPSPYISNVLPRNALAVTGACLAIERSKFEALGRFDESFIICGSDVEFGIRAYEKNYFNVIQSAVKLYHHESKSRGSFVPENDFIQSSIKYEPYRTQKTDPFFNPNLSLFNTTPTCKI